jgi:K+-sensing histidine kinase KdpD
LSSVCAAILVQAAITLALVAVATALIFALRDLAHIRILGLVSVIYLIPVLLTAVWWGTWPAMLAAVCGAAASDLFFYPPLFSLKIEDPRNIADLIVFLIVALVCGNFTASVRRHEQEIQDLYAYSKRLAACFTTADLIRATQDHLSQVLGHPTVLVEQKNMEDAAAVPDEVRAQAAAMAARNDLTMRSVADPASRQTWLIRPIRLGSRDFVVFVDLGIGAPGVRRRINRRVDAILTEATENLVRIDIANAIDEAMVQAQADALRNALVATVSHDLRTPLVSILGAASVLDKITGVRANERARSLVATVHDQAARLDSDIQNLVDAARITAGVGRPQPELTDPVDIVNAAIRQKSTQLAEHRLNVVLAPNLPLVSVQSVLVENAVAQLLDNAAKYSPAGSTIDVTGVLDQGSVVLAVSDHGVGLTPEEREQAGQKSFRSARHAASTPGSGLGLWIANTFVAASGGKLSAESAGPGLGTTFRIRLPAAHGNRPA